MAEEGVLRVLVLAAGTGRGVHLIADPVAHRAVVADGDRTVEAAEPGLHATALVSRGADAAADFVRLSPHHL